MNIQIKIGKFENKPAEIQVFYLYEDSKTFNSLVKYYDNALNNAISGLLNKKEFIPKLNKTIILPTYGKIPAKRIMLVGLGIKKDITSDKIRQAAGVTAATLHDAGIKEITSIMDSIEMPASKSTEWYQAYIEGFLLSQYKFQKYKQVPPEEQKEIKTLILLLSDKDISHTSRNAVNHGRIIADAVCFTRDLTNTPAQDKTPTILADIAEKMARELGIKCKTLSTPELKKLGMGGILGISRGSAQPPKFTILEYNPHSKNQDTIVFVGKGLTFDSGGICLKQAKDMDQMKGDMSGGGAVLGTLKTISRMNLNQHIIGLIPWTENMPDGSAIKPGDIIKFCSGKTAEVVNTDAEGRLILADALTYAEKYKPTAVIDLATLTGSCVVALGSAASGMLGNNDELKKRVKVAGEKTWERVWELPLWEDYQEQIKSDIADIKNIGGPYAGAITAACFLSKFTEKYPWVHLDIAGTSWSEKNTAYLQKGATGVGVRLLTQLVVDWTKLH